MLFKITDFGDIDRSLEHSDDDDDDDEYKGNTLTFLNLIGPRRVEFIVEKDIEELRNSIRETEENAYDENKDRATRERAKEKVARETHPELFSLILKSINLYWCSWEWERTILDQIIALWGVINIFKKYGFTVSAVVLAVGTTIGVIVSALKRGLRSVAILISSIVGFIFKTAGPTISFLGLNAWLLNMGVAIFVIERFQWNKQWRKKAETSPAEINPTFTLSWFVSSNPDGFFTYTSDEVLLIGFEGWEIGLLIVNEPPCALLRLFSSPNSLICWLPASCQHLPSSGCYYTQMYSVCSEEDLRVWALVHALKPRANCEIQPDFCLIDRERKSLDALWNVRLFDGNLNQNEELTLSPLCASSLTRDWWSDIDLRANASIAWFSLAIPACVRPFDLSSMKNCLSTFALSFLIT